MSAPGEARRPAATQPASRHADGSAKAGAALKELAQALLDRPEVPITVPSGPRVERAAPRKLPAEGAMVIDERCRLGRDEEAGMFSVLFEQSPTGRMELPRRLLPCRLLEVMESAAKENPRSAFRVSGETTIYAGNAYMLLIKVTPEVRAIRTPAAPPAAKDGEKGPGEKPAGTTKKDKTPPSAATQPAASPQDVIRELLADKPSRLSQPPSVAPEKPQPVGGGRKMIIDRLVRIMPEKDDPDFDDARALRWWTARFESDNTLREPPIRLLPSATLQRAQTVIEANKRLSVAFRISGEITTYKGRRYLMLRKLVRERNMGRF